MKQDLCYTLTKKKIYVLNYVHIVYLEENSTLMQLFKSSHKSNRYISNASILCTKFYANTVWVYSITEERRCKPSSSLGLRTVLAIRLIDWRKKFYRPTCSPCRAVKSIQNPVISKNPLGFDLRSLTQTCFGFQWNSVIWLSRCRTWVLYVLR